MFPSLYLESRVLPEEDDDVGVDDGQHDERHDVLYDQDDHGEAVLVARVRKVLGADLHQQDVRVRKVHLRAKLGRTSVGRRRRYEFSYPVEYVCHFLLSWSKMEC